MQCICELIKFTARDGYIYTGLLFRAKKATTTVIHVHGSCGDFISFTPLKTVAMNYINNGINLLTFNLKGHDCIAEGNWTNGKYEYVGGSITRFDECINDIQSAIDYCNEFSNSIILQGHSLGCDRVVHYQLQTRNYYPTILLSPCDSYELQKKYLGKENSVEDFILKVMNFQPRFKYEFLPPGSYGVNNEGENYDIPMTKEALLSIMSGPPYKLFHIEGNEKYLLPINCLVCIGKNDKLQTCSMDEMLNYLRPKFKSLNEILIDADHEMEPKGIELSELLIGWLNKNILNK